MRHRRTLRTQTAIALALTAALIVPAGCGVVYKSPKVSRAAAAGMDVRTIEVTPETVLLANRSPFSPRNLPREFSTVASTRQGPGLATLPQAPETPDRRPTQLDLRLPPDVEPSPYRIGVGDVVLLATKENGTSVEQLSGLLAAQTRRQGYTVSDDGAISIPDIGEIAIAGLTLNEAQDRIFKFLLDNQIDPAFSLEVTEFNAQRVTVGGAVRQAARVPVTLVPLRLGDALTATGGVVARDEEFTSIRLYRDGLSRAARFARDSVEERRRGICRYHLRPRPRFRILPAGSGRDPPAKPGPDGCSQRDAHGIRCATRCAGGAPRQFPRPPGVRGRTARLCLSRRRG
jgi:polysaccharide export outer membrane protein